MKKISLPRTEAAFRSAIEAGAASRKALGRAMHTKYESMKDMIKSPSTSSRKLSTSIASDDDTKSLFDVLKEMWIKPVSDLPVSKDIPRLTRRVEIVEEVSGKELFNGRLVFEDITAKMAANGAKDENEEGKTSSASAVSSSSATLSRENEQKASAEMVLRMIFTLVKVLEPDRADELEKKLLKDTLEGYNGTGDMIMFCDEVITMLGGDQSPTVRVLKTVQQEIVLHCTLTLKELLTKNYFTKDVRTPEGWRIVILVGVNRVQVVHIRREQSIDTQGNTANHWEYQWELRMLFGIEMTELHSAQLRVTDLFLAETIDKNLEDDLRKTIVGDVIVA